MLHHGGAGLLHVCSGCSISVCLPDHPRSTVRGQVRRSAADIKIEQIQPYDIKNPFSTLIILNSEQDSFLPSPQQGLGPLTRARASIICRHLLCPGKTGQISTYHEASDQGRRTLTTRRGRWTSAQFRRNSWLWVTPSKPVCSLLAHHYCLKRNIDQPASCAGAG